MFAQKGFCYARPRLLGPRWHPVNGHVSEQSREIPAKSSQPAISLLLSSGHCQHDIQVPHASPLETVPLAGSVIIPGAEPVS